MLFLNNDTEHSSEWIEKLVHFLDSNSNIAAVQPKILNIYNKKLFDYAGGTGGFIDKFCFPFVQGRIFDTLEEDHGQYNNPSKIFWASGAAIMIRSNVFKELEGFDKIYFSYMEEIDFCWRVQSLGHEVWSFPSSYIYHHGPYKNFRKSSINSYYLNHRNSWILFLKNSYNFNYGLSIVLKLLLDWIALAYSLLRLNLKQHLGIIKAHWWLCFSLYKIFKLRKENQYKLNQLDNIYRGSIVVDYFLRRKKYFSQISLK